MHFSILALIFLVLCPLSHADVAEKFQENCNTPEVKELTGDTGSCRIVIAPKKIQKKGTCIGNFMGVLPCTVGFLASPASTKISFICGDPRWPGINVNADKDVEAIGFNVATLIRTSDAQDVVQNDENEYALFSSPTLELSLGDISEDGISTTKILNIIFHGRPISLNDVSCQ